MRRMEDVGFIESFTNRELGVPVTAAKVPAVTGAPTSRCPAIPIRSFLAVPTARDLASGRE